jgi:hypothetical protein
MDVTWDFFQNDLRVTEVVPSQKFAVWSLLCSPFDSLSCLLFQEKISKILDKTPVVSFDFSGLDQLTDEGFLVLSDKYSSTTYSKQKRQVKCVKCVGCIHITDYAIKLMADIFPALEEVRKTSLICFYSFCVHAGCA